MTTTNTPSKYYLIPYSCLGDQISMSPIVHWLREEKSAKQIVILCTRHLYKTIKHLYSDYPDVIPYPVESDYHFMVEKLKFVALPPEQRDGFTLMAFGNFGDNPDFLKLDRLDLNCLYLQHGIPKDVRFTHFRLPKDLSESERRYEALVSAIGKEYVVIHDDPSRILVLNYDKIRKWLENNSMLHLPIIYLGKNRYNYINIRIQDLNTPDVSAILDTDDALDFVHILRNAKACHMMDSSFAILLDYIADVNSPQKRVSYVRQPRIKTSDIYHIEWEYEETRTMINEFDRPSHPI